VTAADPEVPKLPRGRGMRFSGPELFRIAITLAFLVAVIVLTKPCSSAVSTFVMGFDGSGSAKGSGSGSAKPDPYEHLTPNMSEADVKAAIERSKVKNAAAGSGSNTGSGSNAGSGSAAPAPGSAGSAGPSTTLRGRIDPAALAGSGAQPVTAPASP
jgi:hypothetical protein